MVIYGVEGVGKTTFACDAPNAIIGDVEGGSEHIDTATRVSVEQFKCFADIMDFLRDVKESEFESVVLDSLTKIEQHIWNATVKRKSQGKNNYKSVEDIPYKQGYIFALDEWQQFIDACVDLKHAGKRVILVGHNHTKKFDDPTMMEGYQRYEIEIHHKAASLIRKYVDAVLFANHKTLVKEGKGLETGERVLFTERRPGHDAKNRYCLPYEIPLNWSEFIAAKNKSKIDPDVLKRQILEVLPEIQNVETVEKIKEALSADLTIQQLKAYQKRVETIIGAQEE